MKKLLMLSTAFMLVAGLAFANADGGGKKGKKKAKHECISEKSCEKKACCSEKKVCSSEKKACCSMKEASKA